MRWRFTAIGHQAAIQRAGRALTTIAEEVGRGAVGFGNYEVKYDEVVEAANIPGIACVSMRRMPFGALMLTSTPGAHVAVRITMPGDRSAPPGASTDAAPGDAAPGESTDAAPGESTDAAPGAEKRSETVSTPCEYVTLYGAPAWAPAALPAFAGLAPGEPRRV